jgi:regulator of sigma E protease
MTTILGSAWWLIVTLALLVTFHEFGHYWVARRCGVKVLRFSIGFGRALWSRIGRDGTEYRIAMIPLGGYVKMLDAREGEPIPDELKNQEFTGKPVWQRIAIVAAGPVFNIIFAIAAFWLMFVIGRPDSVPVVARPAVQTLAAQAGFQSGDRIVAVDGQPVKTWTGAMDAISNDALLHQAARVAVNRHDGARQTLTLRLDTLPVAGGVSASFDRIGLQPGSMAPVADAVTPDSPAAHAGIQVGDRILRVDGQPVHFFTDIGVLIQQGMKTADRIRLDLQRDGKTLSVQLQPKAKAADSPGPHWQIGIGASTRSSTGHVTLRYGPIDALGHSLRSTWDTFATSFRMIGRILTGQASSRNISGVITIARASNSYAQMGPSWFLQFLALVSLSLAVINLLPIPVLDGGHLLYYLIELVKGSPVSERVMIAGQFVGLALLTCIIGLALYNDILGIPS